MEPMEMIASIVKKCLAYFHSRPLPANWSREDFDAEAAAIASATAWMALNDTGEHSEAHLRPIMYLRAKSAVRTRLRPEYRYSSRTLPYDAVQGWAGQMPANDDPAIGAAAADDLADQGEEVREWLERWPDEQRLVMDLIYLGGFTEAETASVLHVSPAAVHRRRREAICCCRSMTN